MKERSQNFYLIKACIRARKDDLDDFINGDISFGRLAEIWSEDIETELKTAGVLNEIFNDGKRHARGTTDDSKT